MEHLREHLELHVDARRRAPSRRSAATWSKSTSAPPAWTRSGGRPASFAFATVKRGSPGGAPVSRAQPTSSSRSPKSRVGVRLHAAALGVGLGPRAEQRRRGGQRLAGVAQRAERSHRERAARRVARQRELRRRASRREQRARRGEAVLLLGREADAPARAGSRRATTRAFGADREARRARPGSPRPSRSRSRRRAGRGRVRSGRPARGTQTSPGTPPRRVGSKATSLAKRHVLRAATPAPRGARGRRAASSASAPCASRPGRAPCGASSPAGAARARARRSEGHCGGAAREGSQLQRLPSSHAAEGSVTLRAMFPIRDENPTTTPPIVDRRPDRPERGGVGAAPGPRLASRRWRARCASSASSPASCSARVAAGTRVALGPGVACVIGGGASWYTPLTSMFMHGSWLHIDRQHVVPLGLRRQRRGRDGPRAATCSSTCVCGLAAAAAQTLADPASAVPMVGASGAIGGVMGAYAVLFPHARDRRALLLRLLRAGDPDVGDLHARLLVRDPARLRLGRAAASAASPSGPTSAGFAAGAALAMPFSGRWRRAE